MATLPLSGRGAELRVLDDLIDRVHQQGSALVVRGEAGIGKSALLAATSATAAARGMRVLTTTGWEQVADYALTWAVEHATSEPVAQGAPERAGVASGSGA